MTRSWTGVLFVACAAALGGCEGAGGYTLRGKVVESDISFAVVVDESDDRLSETGIAGARIELHEDPTKVSRELIGETVSDGNGEFSIKVDRVGAGLFLYDVGVRAEKRGFEGTELDFRLPPSGKRVLIMMRPGRDPNAGREEDDSWQQYEKFR